MKILMETENKRLKIIFLDIDGVLVTNESMQRSGVGRHAEPDPSCVTALNEIIRQTGAKIVPTSSWRILGTEFVAEKLREWNVFGEVIGETPRISKHQDYYVSVGRAFEIDEWLNQNTDRVSSFVILDDSEDLQHLRDFQIKTDLENGLLEMHIAKALELLKD